jgi:hypothetical protein
VFFITKVSKPSSMGVWYVRFPSSFILIFIHILL